MAVATLTSKSRIALPAPVCRALGLEPGDRVKFVEPGKNRFAILTATCSVQELKGFFQGKRSKPVSIKEMRSAIATRILVPMIF